MSRKYKIADKERPYFVTFTVINWIDVFIREEYRSIFLDSVHYCQEHKGLEVNAWCIMTSHIHMILSATAENPLEGIIRDMKSFTSRSIRKVLEDGQLNESRKEWMYWMMQRAGKQNSNNKDYQFWQQHNQPIELQSEKFIKQKLDYIHMNPVEAGFVKRPEDWQYSSCADYYGIDKGVLELVFLE
jgi:putative transposase